MRAWKELLVAAICVLAIALPAGCAHVEQPPTIAHRPVTLPTIPRPVLPPVAATAVQCLSPSAYRRLVERERLLRNWGLAEQAVIQKNNEHAAKPPGGKP